MVRSNILEGLGVKAERSICTESNQSIEKKAPKTFGHGGCVVSLGHQVRYLIKNSEIPGKNSSSKVRMVSLIRKGMMPL